VIIQPIGFVCDHVEILYDIDILFRQYASLNGIELHRAPSLNDSPLFIDLLVQLAQQ
jgi:ferrochelatase